MLKSCVIRNLCFLVIIVSVLESDVFCKKKKSSSGITMMTMTQMKMKPMKPVKITMMKPKPIVSLLLSN